MKKNLICVCVAFYSLFLYCQHAMAWMMWDLLLEGNALSVTIHNESPYNCSLKNHIETHGDIKTPSEYGLLPYGPPQDILLSQGLVYGVEEELAYTCENQGQVVFNVSQPFVFVKGQMPEVKVILQSGISVHVNSIYPSYSSSLRTAPGKIDLSLVYLPSPTP